MWISDFGTVDFEFQNRGFQISKSAKTTKSALKSAKSADFAIIRFRPLIK